jgi:hypothetical protein
MKHLLHSKQIPETPYSYKDKAQIACSKWNVLGGRVAFVRIPVHILKGQQTAR